MACQTNFFLRIEMGPTIFENWVMETENWVMRIDKPNGPLNFFFVIGNMSICNPIVKLCYP